jgi:hypothetical protein
MQPHSFQVIFFRTVSGKIPTYYSLKLKLAGFWYKHFLGIPRVRDYMGGFRKREREEIRKYSFLATHARLAPPLLASCSGSSKIFESLA